MMTSNGMDSLQNQEPRSQTKKSNTKKILAWVAIIIVVAASYGAGWKAGNKGFIFNPKTFSVVNENNAPKTVDYSLLWDAINVLNSKYINQPIDQQKVLYGAVAGAVNAVGDPYTTFFPPQNLKDFKTQLAGSFGGIGAEVGSKDGNTVIIAPISGAPAEKAGLLAGDIIAAVNASSTQGLSVDDVVNEIRGPKGTQVKITIIRAGKDKPFDVTITRDTITIKSVRWSYKDVTSPSGQKETIAVLNISEFGDDTTGLVNQAVQDILAHNVNGIVVDLRNNPGGYLQSAVDVASNWLKGGDTVVSEAHSDGTTITYKAEGGPKLANIKTEVLINGGSASAAEILSGALHDHGFAQLIGEKSFGKGSVQELVDLPGGSAVKVTIAKWITPNGVNLNHNGLNPDIPVTLTQDQVNAGKDPQMDAAVQAITK